MTTIVRFFLLRDLSAHTDPPAGQVFHEFLRCTNSGYIRKL